MKRIILLGLFVALVCNLGKAQQDAMYTKYMFNGLAYNPAYAGSNDHMSIGLLHRTQWWGIKGAPMTQSFSIHSPLKAESIGLGFNLVSDVIGPTHTINATGSYAYRIPVGAGKIAIGIQGSIMNWRANWNKLDFESEDDDAFNNRRESRWIPNFGAGVYYSIPNLIYVGVGVPRLIEFDLRDMESINTAQSAKQYRHYFFTVGGAIKLGKGDNLVFKPSLLIKNVGMFTKNKGSGDSQSFAIAAPTEFDIDLSLLFQKTFWVGASFRSSAEAFIGKSSSFDSVDLWAAYFLKKGLRIGAAYDYTLTKLQSPAQGSFELFLGYEFDYEMKRIVTPRYF